MKTGSKEDNSGLYFQAIAGTVVVIGVIIFVFFLYRITTKEAEVVLSQASIEINGLYGVDINYNDISEVELKDTIPVIITKTNGSGFGEGKKGDFELEGLGKCRLFICADKEPYVFIKADGKYVIINFKDSSKTEVFYKELMGKWKK